jgi:hypothetical protein
MRQRKKEKAKLKKINKLKAKIEVQKQEVQKQEVQKQEVQKQVQKQVQKPMIQNNTNNFNFDQFLGNVDKMINVLNKWNANMRPQVQPQVQSQPQTRPQKQRQIQKPVHKKVIQQPSTMDFLNINCNNNFRRPFE